MTRACALAEAEDEEGEFKLPNSTNYRCVRYKGSEEHIF